MALRLATKPLGPEEQRLYFYLESTDTNAFRVSELDGEALGMSRGYLHVMASRMARKGWLSGAGKGVYLRLPACAALEGGAYLEDPFEVGLKMFQGYLAFHSALRVHQLSEHQPFTVFVATRGRSETVPLLRDYEVRAVKAGRGYSGACTVGKYSVSTVTKTLFDCLMRPQYAGGYHEVLKAMSMAGGIDWAEMDGYASRLAPPGACQKIGYVMTIMGETGFRAPSWFLERLRGRARRKAVLGRPRGRASYDGEWMVEDNIGRESLLSWWYGS